MAQFPSVASMFDSLEPSTADPSEKERSLAPTGPPVLRKRTVPGHFLKCFPSLDGRERWAAETVQVSLQVAVSGGMKAYCIAWDRNPGPNPKLPSSNKVKGVQ